ncbi:MAG: hypothetical protein AAGK37_15820 [Pseudomonadota bacterium]
MVEFSDKEDIERWLQDKPREVAIALAARSALRALPGIAQFDDETFRGLALPTLRAPLVSAVAAVGPSAEARIRDTAHSAAGRGKLRDADPALLAAHSAALSARSAADPVRLAAHSAALSARSAAAHSALSAESAAYSAAGIDAGALDADQAVGGVFHTALWPADDGNWAWTDFAQRLFDAFDADPTTWGFWARWYRGFLEGKPMPWDLQEAVALIPDDAWDAGPERVAERIREIEARFELKARIAELEVEVTTASGNRHGIGGNKPPEPIGGPQPIAKELVVIWEPVQELKSQADSDKPDVKRIGELLDALAAALKTGLAWCASKLDLAVDTTIKWGIPAGSGYLVLNPQKLQAVIEAGKQWLGALY